MTQSNMQSGLPLLQPQERWPPVAELTVNRLVMICVAGQYRTKYTIRNRKTIRRAEVPPRNVLPGLRDRLNLYVHSIPSPESVHASRRAIIGFTFVARRAGR